MERIKEKPENWKLKSEYSSKQKRNQKRHVRSFKGHGNSMDIKNENNRIKHMTINKSINNKNK